MCSFFFSLSHSLTSSRFATLPEAGSYHEKPPPRLPLRFYVRTAADLPVNNRFFSVVARDVCPRLSLPAATGSPRA